MPSALPLMVVRMHVRRARALGLEYKTYAAVRKASGRDIMGLLFSSNALRVVHRDAPWMPVDRSDRLRAVEGATKLALVHAPLQPQDMLKANAVLDGAGPAPKFTESWSQMRAHLGDFLTEHKVLRDQVLIIGDTAFERDWSAAARAGGYLDASRYFG